MTRIDTSITVVITKKENCGKMQLQLYGDVHAEFKRLETSLLHFNGLTIVLGDLGIGFPHKILNPAYYFDQEAPYMLDVTTNFECSRKKMIFIRGNHDNPEVCRKHYNYLGEFGMFKDIFFVSGAWSIDRDVRIQGQDWWPDEELSIIQGNECIDLYEKKKPDIIISHDCPSFICKMLHNNHTDTRTGTILGAMLAVHQPKMWFFAHHHLSWKTKIENTIFRCLNCHERVTI
jgi:hypothetical protein